MPESNFAQPADRAAMREMIRDVESQIDGMSRSLESLRAVVSRLSSALNSGESAGARYNFGFEAAPARTEESAPFDFSAAAAALSQELAGAVAEDEPAATMSPPAPQPVIAPRSYDVITTRQPDPPVEPQPEPEPEWHGVADGASWPIAPRRAEALQPLPAPVEPETLPELEAQVMPEAEVMREPEPMPRAESSDESRAEAVWQAAPIEAAEPVETSTMEAPAFDESSDWSYEPKLETPPEVADATQAAGPPPAAEEKPAPRSLSSGWPDESMWSQSFEWPAMRNQGQAPEAPAVPEESPRDPNDFRSIVDQVKAEIEAARASGQTIDLDDTLAPETAADEEARRAEVQRMVEEMRDRMSAGGIEDLDLPPSPPESDEEAARREEARRAVEQMRAELAGSATAAADAEQANDEDVRDEVRRAVEAAKAELSGGPAPVFPPAAPPAMDWSHMQADTSGPPVIVVKDNEGRVELASVYDMLNRLDCGESAALLNYTPHSVTIGLPIRAATPAAAELTAAVKDVFGRECSVDTDGPRITIQIGTDPKKKRSEDAA